MKHLRTLMLAALLSGSGSARIVAAAPVIGPMPLSPPAAVCLDFSWRSPPEHLEWSDTLLCDLAPGSWISPFRLPRAIPLGYVPGLRLLGIQSPELTTVWTPGCGSGGFLGDFRRERDPDSVLVATTWRSFTFPVSDGPWFECRLRVHSSLPPELRPADSQADVSIVGTQSLGESDAYASVRMAAVAGLFRLVEAMPPKSSRLDAALQDAYPHARMRALELWQADSARVGDIVDVVVLEGDAKEHALVPRWDGMPVHLGDTVVLFLYREALYGLGQSLAFSATRSLAYVDSARGRVFNATPLRMTLDSLRTNVNRAYWPLRHPGEGRVLGCVVSNDGSPVSGARIEVMGTAASGRTREDGTFDLGGVTIGRRRIVVEAVRGQATADIDVSDERVDTLRVVLPFKIEAAGH